uniref:Trp biosynthesis-associated membrane protein n=1 Tax=Leucobacter sp. BZR 635 TaxID=3378705 RepID=UPI003A84EB8D
MPETGPNKLTSKATLIGFVIVAGAFALLASVQRWIDLEFLPGAATVERISVTGQQMSPALTLVSLAALAAALVLTIAGKTFRRIIGGLIVLLGVGLSYAGLTAV